MSKAGKATLASFLFALLSLSRADASQVTTQRIIIQPDYSASSGSAPATLTNETESSGTSGASIDGIPAASQPVVGAEGEISGETSLEGKTAPQRPLPTILGDIDNIPRPVREMHGEILRAAKSGKIEALRLAIEMNEIPPILGTEDVSDDPVEQLRALSGDSQGSEILAILTDILESDFVLSEAGTPREMYVWPYFADMPLDYLSAPQRVELLRIITSADLAEMEELGHYSFYRLGISADGVWHYFVAGD